MKHVLPLIAILSPYPVIFRAQEKLDSVFLICKQEPLRSVCLIWRRWMPASHAILSTATVTAHRDVVRRPEATNWLSETRL